MLDARVDRLEAALARLADAQAQTQVDLRQLTQRIDQLAEAQRRTEGHLSVVARDVGILKGHDLERWYREHADAYFAPVLRRVLSVEERSVLAADAADRGVLSSSELMDLSETDIMLRGRDPDGADTTVAVEVSWVIDPDDVARAARRSALLGRATGLTGMAAVDGRDITEVAVHQCQTLRVWRVLDGQATPPPAP